MFMPSPSTYCCPCGMILCDIYACDEYAPAAQPAFASDAWFCVIFKLFFLDHATFCHFRPVRFGSASLLQYGRSVLENAGSLSNLGCRLAAKPQWFMTSKQWTQPHELISAGHELVCYVPEWGIFQSLLVPEVRLRSGLVTHSEGFSLCWYRHNNVRLRIRPISWQLTADSYRSFAETFLQLPLPAGVRGDSTQLCLAKSLQCQPQTSFRALALLSFQQTNYQLLLSQVVC